MRNEKESVCSKLCLYVSECVCSKIIKELPGLVGSGTPCIITERNMQFLQLGDTWPQQRSA